jgi:hypothetical protein
MTMDFTANQNFTVDIIEEVPGDFVVTETTGTTSLPFHL